MTSTASSSIPQDEWLHLFHKFDVESDGKADGRIPLERFRAMLEQDPLWVDMIPAPIQERILASADKNNDGYIDQDEFFELYRGRGIRGFGRQRRQALRELLKQTVEFIVPYKYSYQNQYSCSPPPLFMLCLSLLQFAIFAYNSVSMGAGLDGPVPHCSHLIFDPAKRSQVWRYITYMFIHSGLFHVTFNLLVQLILGIPLEMVHGTLN